MSIHAETFFPVFSLSLSFVLLLVTFGRGCDPNDRAALLAFSNALDSPVWSAANRSTTDCCRWDGVSCSNDSSPGGSAPVSPRRVVRLNLTNMTLSGPLSSSLGRLNHLAALLLSINRFSGPIPRELFLLSSLKAIDLSHNFFSGSLSPALGNLSSLLLLRLGGNKLSGIIPDVFYGLKRFRYLDVSHNLLSGPLPASLSSCSNLQYIDASGNSLSGWLHINFTNFPGLEALMLQGNQLSGGFSESISSCKKLQVLDLRDNELHGHISWEIFPSSLSYVLLAGNNFSNVSGALLSFQKFPNLTALDLSGNFKKEVMPRDGIIGFPRLKALAFMLCELYGEIPMWLSRSTELVQLDLSGNYFTGEIPLFLTQLRGLSSPKEQNDEVHSQVTSEAMNLNLGIRPSLYFSNNLLSGNTWMFLSNLSQLVELDLSHNSFSGSIPDDFSRMKSLEYLDLSSNQISGTIPSSLKQLTYLSFFCVANNRLHGDVPTGSQFSTFPSKCFEGNPGLCYVGKSVCNSPAPSATNEINKDEQPSKFIDMGIPFAIGVSVGYCTAFLVGGIHYGRTLTKVPAKYKRRR